MESNQTLLFPDRPDESSEILRQANHVCQAAYSMTVTQKRVLLAAMKKLQLNENDALEATLCDGEILRAYGLSDSKTDYERIRACMGPMSKIQLHIETVAETEFINWFNSILISKDRKTVRFRFNQDLKDVLLNLKKGYTNLPLVDIGKLTSIYSTRIFELLMSYSGFSGKHHNSPGTWYYETSIENLRFLLRIEESKYPVMADFKKRVIEGPINEINKSRIGISISVTYGKKGKRIDSVRFLCASGNYAELFKETEGDEEDLKTKYSDRFNEILNSLPDDISPEKPETHVLPVLFQDGVFSQAQREHFIKAKKEIKALRILKKELAENPTMDRLHG